MRARYSYNKDYPKAFVAIKCPGCNTEHVITVQRVQTDSDRHCWGFNNNFDRPTFTPSLLVRSGKYANPAWYAKLDPETKKDVDETSIVCHSFITDGRIQYLNDCTHELKGQTIDLPEITSL